MKRFILKRDFEDRFKKGTKFYVVSESEFIGVKEYVLRTQDLEHRIVISEAELQKNFIPMN
ncbi:hypothetical protein [Cytobacillus purgationiresistens]|uniref:Uncharacterized protein n=1 Tax=Cytobacillus purgationiresistens TaxID=863449 RepID=A0ABU0APP8_9BACI|nr:hypothetical protein [Cytobacillus purgationiresistens]MDQ0273267.1 hypothetical protein [Cytobacillus purgationiresistens]